MIMDNTTLSKVLIINTSLAIFIYDLDLTKYIRKDIRDKKDPIAKTSKLPLIFSFNHLFIFMLDSLVSIMISVIFV